MPKGSDFVPPFEENKPLPKNTSNLEKNDKVVTTKSTIFQHFKAFILALKKEFSNSVPPF